MTDPVIIRSATELGYGELAKFYRTILAPSFPPDELIDEQELLDGQRAGMTQTLLAVHPTGELLGGVVGDWYASSRVLLISYLAVCSGHRGTGIGGLLYRAALDRWSREMSPELILGEVEDTSRTASAAYGDPVARLRFYAQFGAQVLDMPYFQPALRPGASRVSGLLLVVFAAGPTARRGAHRIDGGIIERFIQEYLEATEGAIRADDQELSQVIEPCHLPEGIPVRDIFTVLAAQRHE